MDASTKSSRHLVAMIISAAWCLLLFFACVPAVANAQETTPPDFKIAFIGDQGLGPNAVAILNLIKAEGAQAILHSGDLEYTDNPAAWEAQINSVLGANFPYFVTIGNHDELAWSGPNGYGQYVESRFNRLGIKWSGKLGVKSTFYYKGLFFVLTAPGITSGFDDGTSDLYIRDQLAADNSIWSICSWHKNMSLMQLGSKTDETGWGVYEEARKGGAIIATAHEHSYSRTYLLSSMVNQTVASTSNTLNLSKGNSFAFVSGLGGHSVRPQVLTGNWWASEYASTCLAGDQVCQPNATLGALFAVFNVDGQPNKALFYFKDLNGHIVDSFVVISNVETPLIKTVTPSSAEAGGGNFTLTVDGLGFNNGSVVQLNGVSRPTTFVSQARLTAVISAADIAATGTPLITVFNPAPGGGTSNALALTVNNPQPTIAGLTPASALAGSGTVTLTVNGTGFNSSSQVRFAGSNRATGFTSPTQLTVQLTAQDTKDAGVYALTVFNPTPGGGTSGEANLTINNPTPSVTTLSPQQATAGGPDLTLVVNGSGFVSNSVVRWNNLDRPTAFISPTQLTATITSTDITTSGSFNLTVANPTPGGGTSTALVFTVNNPQPTIAGLAPTTVLAGSGALTLTVNGAGFNSSSRVWFAGSNRTTGFTSPTQLTVQLTAQDLTAAGVYPLTVFNPTPGGGTSGEASLTVNNPVPSVTTLSPQQATAGGPNLMLVINGSGFISNSVVRWNNLDRPTAFISPTQLTATIARADIATYGSFNLTVVNPAPGGGTSNVQSFTVNGPPPKLLTEEGTGRAIALDSLTWMKGPFPLLAPYNFSADKHTRVMLFAADVDLTPTDSTSLVTAQAEDSQNRVYPLAVEYVGKVPGFDWLWQVIVKLPDELGNVGEVRVSLTLRGTSSNLAPLGLK